MREFAVLSFACAVTIPLVAQVSTRHASMKGYHGDHGKCTIEVEVDGVAEVEIIGDNGRLRTLSGTPAVWRRFECNEVMPFIPLDFRFTGVDGRGRQTLIREPRSSRGAAVIRIEDPQSGREGYTFDIEWRGSGSQYNGWRGGPAWPIDRAIRMCEDAARDEAWRAYRLRDVAITRSAVDTAPGHDDWIVGNLESRQGERFRYACIVDTRNRRVRSVEVTRR